MNVVIIEDEKMVADDLAAMLKEINGDIRITSTLSSVKETVRYMRSGQTPHLIFSDILLGDGYSFEAFSEAGTPAPVIYCTAFNQHALEAFNNNGIAYVLKPYSKDSIKKALLKYQLLEKAFTPAAVDYTNLLDAVRGKTTRPVTLLVSSANRIIPVKTSDVAFFGTGSRGSTLYTFGNMQYDLTYPLDELEAMCGENFFRASRQYLVNKAAVKEVMHYGLRKLFVELSVQTGEEIVVNKTRITAFLNWLKE
ncbi:MAG: LytTR family DNA-binding domain-containing protein [Ferruginibacter sp.]